MLYDDTTAQTLGFHRSMLADAARSEAYLKAILRVVRPGDVVLDIGCGTGILSYFACLAGARRVYAVEQGPVIGLARDLCDRNGLTDRVVFLEGWSSDVDIPEPVDAIVTETIGNAGFEEGIVGWLRDARDRFLRVNGVVVPESLSLVAAPVETAHDYAEVEGWRQLPYGFDFGPAAELAARQLWWTRLSPVHLLGDGGTLFTSQLCSVVEPDVRGSSTVAVKRNGTMHGIGLWFRSTLARGIAVDNCPDRPSTSWYHGFLPLENPLSVTAGEGVKLAVGTRAGGAGWEWSVTLPSGTTSGVRSTRAL